jgi:hypothetical protein
MKTIIAGSRFITDYDLVKSAIKESEFVITEVVSGLAPGIDTLGIEWAKENNIKWCGFQANWNEFGKAAGPKRNQKMADYADALIAIWDGSSKGTKDMIDRAKKKGLKVFIKNPDEYNINKFFEL